MDKFYDADGNDITEKVKAQFQSTQDAKVKEFQDQLTVLQTENATLKEKDANFTNLKTKYEADLKEVTDKLTAVTTNVITDKKNETLKRFSGGNKEVTDKIEAELKALNLPMNNATEIETAITKAAAIVGVVEKNPLSNMAGHMGGRGTHEVTPGTVRQETPEEREGRLKFGITDAMAAKHFPAESGITPLIVDKPAA
jgi:ribosomal protein S8E